jgi:predicted unusual protein kinase regulating ubiquinone biosynthesis (AarF/ABC1/UbiB family)
LSTDRVLTMSFLEGISLDEFLVWQGTFDEVWPIVGD